MFGVRKWLFVLGWDYVGVCLDAREGSVVREAVWLCTYATRVLLAGRVGGELDWGL